MRLTKMYILNTNFCKKQFSYLQGAQSTQKLFWYSGALFDAIEFWLIERIN